MPQPAYQEHVKLPIPQPTNQLLGMTSRELSAIYGSPAISASTVNSDSFVETQVFVDDSRGTSTILRLEDGVVIEVQEGAN